MKRLISILLLFVFFAAFPAFAEQGEQFILCKPGTVVNVRKRPEKDAPVTAWVECGQKIAVDDEKNGFVRTDKAIGNTGHFDCDVRYIKELSTAKKP